MRAFISRYAVTGAALALVLSLSSGAGAQVAPDGGFTLPLKCTLDRDCWIINLPDAAPDKKALDHRCGFRTYDGHKGTDFAVRDFRSTDGAGAEVIAAGPGLVTAARDGSDEFFKLTPEARKLVGREECGNGVIVQHKGGWESQYCHMRKGSISVKLGDRVKRGDRLGLVGMSGRTQFPHVHIAFRVDGKTIDPFTGTAVATGCEGPKRPIWHKEAKIGYPAFALYAAGFTDHTPSRERIRSSARSPVSMPRHAPALVLWAAMFGVQRGDVLKMRILDPGGTAIVAREIRLDRAQAWRMEVSGRKLPPAGWKTGGWIGEAVLQRFVNGRTVTRRINVPLVVK
ncbi:MAG: M23 family metallopeptidase [Alphaproteobacteria bacterium]